MGTECRKNTKYFINIAMDDAHRESRTRYALPIVPMGKDVVIGAGELNIRDFVNSRREIGFIVHPDFWGKGIATCVAKMLIDFGFKECILHRIFATCDPENTGSSKVLGKAGMIREGKIRDHLLLKEG